jgi:hypothetical protein
MPRADVLACRFAHSGFPRNAWCRYARRLPNAYDRGTETLTGDHSRHGATFPLISISTSIVDDSERAAGGSGLGRANEEFGTSSNVLEQQGCGLKMGDTVPGLVIEEMRAEGIANLPNWLVIAMRPTRRSTGIFLMRRNADVPAPMRRALNMQAHWGRLVLRILRLLDEREQHDCRVGERLRKGERHHG